MIKMTVSKRVNREDWVLIGDICFKDGKFVVEGEDKAGKKRVEHLLKGAKGDKDILSFINDGEKDEKYFKKKPEDEPVLFLRGLRRKTTPYMLRFGLVETGVRDIFGYAETEE